MGDVHRVGKLVLRNDQELGDNHVELESTLEREGRLQEGNLLGDDRKVVGEDVQEDIQDDVQEDIQEDSLQVLVEDTPHGQEGDGYRVCEIHAICLSLCFYHCLLLHKQVFHVAQEVGNYTQRNLQEVDILLRSGYQLLFLQHSCHLVSLYSHSGS